MRRVARFVVPVCFVVATVVAGALTLPWFKLDRAPFAHQYPSAPGVPVGDVLGVPLAAVPATNDITQFTIRSLRTLAQALPPEAVNGDAHHLHITEPVVIANGGSVLISGPGTITLERGSFIEVAAGGSLQLRGITVRANGATNDRGFLLALGGTMTLANDHFYGLGRVATLASGISFVSTDARSSITNCTITDGLNGVYATRSSALTISQNSIFASRLDGIQIQASAAAPMILSNRIANSGHDGISLTGTHASVRIRDNVVLNSVRYGVLIYNSSGALELFANRVTGAYDGIVLNSTSHAAVRANAVSGAQRFALRLSGDTRAVEIAANQLSDSAVGVYVSGGPRANRIVSNQYSANGENVRIRTNSPGNVVVPVPLRSELASG